MNGEAKLRCKDSNNITVNQVSTSSQDTSACWTALT